MNSLSHRDIEEANETLRIIKTKHFASTKDESESPFYKNNGVLHYLPTNVKGNYLVISELPVKKNTVKKFDLWLANISHLLILECILPSLGS